MFWSQFHTILWLRWRLTRNQWSRAGRLSVGISIAILVFLLLLGFGGGIGGLVVGIVFGLEEASPAMVLAIYDLLSVAFVLFWVIGVVSTIQRSESVDIGKILHLPVSLRGIFLLNYLASHATPSIVVFVPWMTGLALGLALGRSWMMIIMVPLTLGFLFMLTAWTYHLRGWLVILMRNPRRYRAVVAGITVAFMLLMQLPNLLVHGGARDTSHSPSRTHGTQVESPVDEGANQKMPGIPPLILLAHAVVPPLWVGNGAMCAAEGNPWPALLATIGAFGIGGLGLARAYRSTGRFYEGRIARKKTRAARKERKAISAGGGLLERRIPGISEEAAALALASLRSLTRASEIRMAMASNMVMLIAFGGMALLSRPRDLSFHAQLFYGTGIALLPFLGAICLMTNQFGFDRAAFRTLVLSPMPRSQILLGKNLALLPISVAVEVVYLALAAVALHLEMSVVLAAFAQSLAAFFLVCIPANFVSSLLPYRIREGTMAATKVGVVTVLLNLVSHLVCTGLLSVLLLPAVAAFLMSASGSLMPRLAYLVLSIAELFVIVTVYGLSLFGLGEFLQRREKEILRIVTQEVE